jgi:hypothetical protein
MISQHGAFSLAEVSTWPLREETPLGSGGLNGHQMSVSLGTTGFTPCVDVDLPRHHPRGLRPRWCGWLEVTLGIGDIGAH